MAEEILPSATDIFRQLTVFIDPSLPTILAVQLKALLSHNHGKIASEHAINQIFELQSADHPDQAGSSNPSRNLIANLKPRFDLTQTTHLITNSLHLPEYIALGRWDDQAGNILSFSYHTQPNNGNGSQPSPDSNNPRVYRSIHLISPLWVTQSYDLNKLLPTAAYSPDPYRFFSGIVIALDSAANLPQADVELIQACVQAWGGQFRRGLTKEVTHLICCDEKTRDYQIASKLKVELGLKIVLPHWFHHSVFFRHILSEKPFEFPSPAVLTPRPASMSPDCQHGIDGLPGNKLPPSRNPVEEDPEIESLSHKKATELAFTSQKIHTRPVSQGLSAYLEETNPDSLEDTQPIQHLPQSFLKDSPVYREFQDKSVYLVSSLGLSLSARRTLSRRIEQLGAQVFDSGDLKLDTLDQTRADATFLNDAANAEQNLRTSDIVICEYRTGWEFWLAWEQGKKIGTMHWILGILNNITSPTCAVRPPTERLLDFPSPPGPISGCEKDSNPITVTNYTGTARGYLIRLIEKMHIKFSGSLVPNTSMIVAANKAGSKVAYASKNGMQIVNHHYIEDCFQSWTKQSIQAHHLTFPDGVDISQLVGQSTRTTDGIYQWATRAHVKEQKKRDLAGLPSALVNAPLPASIPPEDQNDQPAASTVRQQIENHHEDSLSDTPILLEVQNPQPSPPAALQPIENRPEVSDSDAQGSTVKRVNRKPMLISDSVELSSITESDMLKVADIETVENSRKPSRQASTVLDKPDPPKEFSPQGSPAAMDVDERGVTPQAIRLSPQRQPSAAAESDPDTLANRQSPRKRPSIATESDPKTEANRQSPRKRPSAAAESDPNPSKKAKKGLNIEASTKEVDTNAQLARVFSLDQPGSADAQESSLTSTPIQSKLTKEAKPSVSTRKGSSQNAPTSAPRSSTRKAAQRATMNVKSAAEDMNLHEKEKRRKRFSGGKQFGLEDGGYFGSPPKKASQPTIRKRPSKDAGGQPTDSESDGNDCPVAMKPIKQSSSKRGRRSAENEKTLPHQAKKREEDEQSGDSSADGPLPSWGMIDALCKKHAEASRGRNKVKEEDHSSGLESITITSAKIPTKKKERAKAEEPGTGPQPKAKAKSAAASKRPSIFGGPSTSKKICITESGDRIASKISSKLAKMGAKFVESVPELADGCTHLLTNKIARTEKFLSCIVLGCHIVTHQWAEECARRNEFVDEEGYELKDAEGEKAHGFELSRALTTARSRKILAGFEIFLSPFVANQHSKLVRKLVLLAGGQVLSKIPPLETLQKTADEINKIHHAQNSRDDKDDEDDDSARGTGKRSVVVSCKEDMKYLKTHLFKKFPSTFFVAKDSSSDARSSVIKIFDSNLILEGLLVQEIRFDPKFELDCSGVV